MDIETLKEKKAAEIKAISEQLARGIWPIDYPSEIGVRWAPTANENDEVMEISENLFILAGQPIAIFPDADDDEMTTFIYHLDGRIITRTVQGESPFDPLVRMQLFYPDL